MVVLKCNVSTPHLSSKHWMQYPSTLPPWFPMGSGSQDPSLVHAPATAHLQTATHGTVTEPVLESHLLSPDQSQSLGMQPWNSDDTPPSLNTPSQALWPFLTQCASRHWSSHIYRDN